MLTSISTVVYIGFCSCSIILPNNNTLCVGKVSNISTTCDCENSCSLFGMKAKREKIDLELEVCNTTQKKKNSKNTNLEDESAIKEQH